MTNKRLNKISLVDTCNTFIPHSVVCHNDNYDFILIKTYQFHYKYKNTMDVIWCIYKSLKSGVIATCLFQKGISHQGFPCSIFFTEVL